MARRGPRRTDVPSDPSEAPPPAGSPRRARPSPRLRVLRATSNEASDRLFLASLRVRLSPDLWAGHFTRRHPEVQLEILNQGAVTPTISVSDYWISGGPPGIWAAEIAAYPDVVKVESLAEVGSGSMYRIAYRNPSTVYLYRRLRLPLQFPQWVEGGRNQVEIVARYSEFEEILKHAREGDPDVEVVSIRRGPLRSHLPMLTETQQRLLHQAMEAGYFAVPRKITLTALARKLNRSKSAISESLALIEKRLLETAMRPEGMSGPPR